VDNHWCHSLLGGVAVDNYWCVILRRIDDPTDPCVYCHFLGFPRQQQHPRPQFHSNTSSLNFTATDALHDWHCTPCTAHCTHTHHALHTVHTHTMHVTLHPPGHRWLVFAAVRADRNFDTHFELPSPSVAFDEMFIRAPASAPPYPLASASFSFSLLFRLSYVFFKLRRMLNPLLPLASFEAPSSSLHPFPPSLPIPFLLIPPCSAT
jgi:hypothetical protein